MKQLLLLTIPFFFSVSVYTQNKKELQAIITRLKSDSIFLENTIQDLNYQMISKNTELEKNRISIKENRALIEQNNLTILNINNKLHENETLSDSIKKKIDFIEKKQFKTLKNNFNYIKAKYVDFSFGDVPNYRFENEKGEEVSFSYQGSDYKLIIDAPKGEESESGYIINEKYINKIFYIFYENYVYTTEPLDHFLYNYFNEIKDQSEFDKIKNYFDNLSRSGQNDFIKLLEILNLYNFNDYSGRYETDSRKIVEMVLIKD